VNFEKLKQKAWKTVLSGQEEKNNGFPSFVSDTYMNAVKIYREFLSGAKTKEICAQEMLLLQVKFN